MINYDRTHPAYVKAGATCPRNQKQITTPADKAKHYAVKARKHGKTVGDILAECKLEELRRIHVYVVKQCHVNGKTENNSLSTVFMYLCAKHGNLRNLHGSSKH